MKESILNRLEALENGARDSKEWPNVDAVFAYFKGAGPRPDPSTFGPIASKAWQVWTDMAGDDPEPMGVRLWDRK